MSNWSSRVQFSVTAAGLLLVALLAVGVRAQEPPLAQNQKDVADRFQKLEDLLLRSAELEALENPTRAALLQQAVQLTKQVQLAESMLKAAKNLEQNQLSEAIQLQKASRENLEKLLTLLQSENRQERIREQREKIRGWIEETDRLLRMQGSLRGRTEGGQELQQAAEDQRRLGDKAESISDDLRGETAGDEPPNSPESATENKPAGDSSDGDSAEPKSNSEDQGDASQETGDPAEQNAETSESSEGEQSQSSESEKQSPSGSNSEESSQSGDSQESQSQEGNSQGDQAKGNPPQSDGGAASESSGDQEEQLSQDPAQRAQQRIERAKARMKAAQQALEEAERDQAVEEQLKAEEELRAAIEELESILRQLREEEIERSLASLEDRLRHMLDMENKILDETERLREIGGEEESRRIAIKAAALSKDQKSVLAEGERALLLLRDEGSSAAFPEAILQVNEDCSKVANRLERSDVGALTIVIEQEIVQSLEEMVAALEKVQRENAEKKKQQQSGQAPSGQPGEQPLIDKLAELRLVRTLQLRVNGRTDTLSKMLQDPADPIGQVEQGEILEELKALANRQDSIRRVTRDINRGE